MAEIEKLQRETGIVLDPERIPRHVAIIMDGNGRWATGQGLPRIMGHARGYETVREIVRASGELGLQALTLYTFSTENWRRPKDETDAIMSLIEQATINELPELMENQVRLRCSGRFSELPASLQKALTDSMAATANNTGLILNLAINYGGRQELLDAVREATRRIIEGKIKPEDITEEYFSGLLYTAGLPDPDLLIRTAGEMRVSNFLLWQIAYAEIRVTPTFWPDFTKKDLMLAIADYQKRVRKFGAVIP
ncbi:MAG TPA: isoprenyl transferase [Armatimonadota bacterium]|nr:isoprenyl transferase [Armatimonadota bacterium]